MITAPRYSSAGVTVSDMPTPQQKADMSGANMLSAIGDTIASVGKSLGAMAKISDDANETVAADYALKAKAEKDAVYKKYASESLMGMAATDRDARWKEIIQIDQKYAGMDMSSGARDKLRRRSEIDNIHYGAAFDTHATVENKKYIVFTADNEDRDLRNRAGFALATGTGVEAGDALIEDAVEARMRVARVRGDIPDTPEGKVKVRELYRADVSITALERAAKMDPRTAVTVYKQLQSHFGAHAEQAKAIAQESLDKVWLSDDFIPAMQQSTAGKQANFSANTFLKDNAEPLGSLSLQRQEMAHAAALRHEAQDQEARKEFATSLKLQIAAARQGGIRTTAQMRDAASQLLWRVPLDQQGNVMDLLNAPATGNERHNSKAEMLIAVGTSESMAELARLHGQSELALSSSMEEKVGLALNRNDGVQFQKTQDARDRLFKMTERLLNTNIVQPWQKNGELSDEDQKKLESATALVNEAMANMVTGKKAMDDPNELNASLNMAYVKLRVANPGWFYGGTTEKHLYELDRSLQVKARGRELREAAAADGKLSNYDMETLSVVRTYEEVAEKLIKAEEAEREAKEAKAREEWEAKVEKAQERIDAMQQLRIKEQAAPQDTRLENDLRRLLHLRPAPQDPKENELRRFFFLPPPSAP